MDRFKVSGEDLRSHYPMGTLLGQVFEDIERELAVEERVVCRYILNGTALDEGEETDAADTPLSGIETLEYLSEDKAHLMGEVISGWLEALPELGERVDEFASALRRGEAQKIDVGLTELVENCEFLVQSLWSIRALIGEKKASELPSWTDLEEATRETLRRVISALEKKDFVQLADLIEYDLNDGLEDWRRLLLSFADQAGTLKNGTGATAPGSVGRKASAH